MSGQRCPGDHHAAGRSRGSGFRAIGAVERSLVQGDHAQGRDHGGGEEEQGDGLRPGPFPMHEADRDHRQRGQHHEGQPFRLVLLRCDQGKAFAAGRAQPQHGGQERRLRRLARLRAGPRVGRRLEEAGQRGAGLRRAAAGIGHGRPFGIDHRIQVSVSALRRSFMSGAAAWLRSNTARAWARSALDHAGCGALALPGIVGDEAGQQREQHARTPI